MELHEWKIPKFLTGNMFAFGRVGCQPKGDKVLMADGSWKNIEDVKVGDEVISPQLDGTNKFSKVTWTTKWMCDEIYDVISTGSKKKLYSCSYNHKIPIKELFTKELLLDNYEAQNLERGKHSTLKFENNKMVGMKVRIKETKRKEFVYGFEIDSESQLYITNNYMVTHNSGKSCKLLSIVHAYKEIGYKLFDISGGKRGEGPFQAFPSDDYDIWNKIQEETPEFKVPGPKQQKIRILYPMFIKKIRNKRLPYNPPNVDMKVFTIPFNDPDVEDDMEQLISLVTGPLSTTSSRIWNKVLSKLDKNATSQDIKRLFDGELSKKKEDKIYDMFLKPAIENNLLANKKSELNINWVAESKDLDTITVLSLDFIPEKFKFFVMAWIIKKISYLVRNNKIGKKNIMMFREAASFMKVMDTDKSKEEITQIFRNIIVETARYCRSGLFLAMDTQDSCLYEDTMIKTLENGVIKNKSIKSLHDSPKLYSYNFASKKCEWTDALKLDKGVADCYEIILSDGRKVIATNNHKFFHCDGTRTTVNKLKIGDDIACIEELEKR